MGAIVITSATVGVLRYCNKPYTRVFICSLCRHRVEEISVSHIANRLCHLCQAKVSYGSTLKHMGYKGNVWRLFYHCDTKEDCARILEIERVKLTQQEGDNVK
jgi:hypothetical protein